MQRETDSVVALLSSKHLCLGMHHAETMVSPFSPTNVMIFNLPNIPVSDSFER